MLWENNHLAHFGIKGQQWGIRRFQNPDGSLTQAGKSRYRLGKQYSKELRKIEDKEFESIRKNSKKYKEAWAESNRLADKYGLDGDDGGGGDTDRYDAETLRRARDRYWEQHENIDSMENKFREDARKKAETKIIEKYGEQALDDIQHYNTRNSAAWLAGLGLAVVSIVALDKLHK